MALKYLYVPSGYKAGSSGGAAGKIYGVLPNKSESDLSLRLATSGTRINSNGLVEKRESLGSELAASNFSSGWTGVGSGMTLSTGSAIYNKNATNTTAYIRTDASIIQDKVYKIVIEVTSFTSAPTNQGLKYYNANGSVRFNIDRVGVFEFIFIAKNTQTLALDSDIGTSLTLGSVSLREVTLDVHVPRIDYSDGGCPTLLTEPQSTNLIQRGENISAWSKMTSTVGVGTGVVPIITGGYSSPEGRLNAHKVIFNKGTGDTVDDYSMVAQTYNQASTGTYTQSVWMRTESGNTNVLLDFNSANTNEVTVTPSWKRFEFTKEVTITGSRTFRIGLRGNNSDNDSATVLIWGGQLEKYPSSTSYIPNYGNYPSGTTRERDKQVYSGDISSSINPIEGVLEANFKGSQNQLYTPWQFSRITLSKDSVNRISIGYGRTAGVVKPFVLIQRGQLNSITWIDNVPSNFDISEYNTYSLKYKSGESQLKINGEIIESTTLENREWVDTENLTHLSFTTYINAESQAFYGNLKYIKVYDSITDF